MRVVIVGTVLLVLKAFDISYEVDIAKGLLTYGLIMDIIHACKKGS